METTDTRIYILTKRGEIQGYVFSESKAREWASRGKNRSYYTPRTEVRRGTWAP